MQYTITTHFNRYRIMTKTLGTTVLVHVLIILTDFITEMWSYLSLALKHFKLVLGTEFDG